MWVNIQTTFVVSLNLGASPPHLPASINFDCYRDTCIGN